MLGGCIWWVTRRLYGNLGGYTALALYCFSPAILKACVSPNPEVLAALGVYGGVYTCIGVAHAMQGPRRKWRPRIVLLTAIFGVAASAHIVALPLAALLGLVAMLWVAEGHRSQTLPVVLTASAGALLLRIRLLRILPRCLQLCLPFRCRIPVVLRRPGPALLSGALPNGGVTVAACAALVLYLAARKSRYFGNTIPFLCALILMLLVTTDVPGSPWLWSLPFLLTFVGGVFADTYEGPRGRLALGAAAAIVLAASGAVHPQPALAGVGAPESLAFSRRFFAPKTTALRRSKRIRRLPSDPAQKRVPDRDCGIEASRLDALAKFPYIEEK